MEHKEFNEAFARGFQKRAEELGLEKEAFIPLLMGAGSLVGGLAADHYLKRGIARLAAAGVAAKRAKTAVPFGAATAKKVNDTLRSKKLKGGLANMATFMGTQAVVDPIFNKITEKLEGPPQQYQPAPNPNSL
jgi:hypothetical protein